ncbi:MAG: hypothetical protein U0414_22680 [Polyangiaceae bacterium]
MEHHVEASIPHTRAALWMDHHEARVFFVSKDGVEVHETKAPHHHVLRHPKGDGASHEHPEDLKRYFTDVAEVLRDAEEVYLVGPSLLKFTFVKFLHEHDRALAAKIAGVESSDHPTDGQLIALARHHFGLSKPRILPSQR